MSVNTIVINVPVTVPNNLYCWDGKTPCDHFDNSDGYSRCLLNIGEPIRDEFMGYRKPIECKELLPWY